MQSNASLPTLRTTPYAPPAVWLHWTLAAFIIGMTALGWYMTSIEDLPGAGQYFGLHKSVGLIVAGLVLLRVLWRLSHRPAPLPVDMSAWQVGAAKMGHGLLYAAMVVMPLSGVIGSMLGKGGIAFFGWSLPRVFAVNTDLSEIVFTVHSATAWVLTGLVAMHVLAALKHLVIDRDGVFQRMWPAR